MMKIFHLIFSSDHPIPCMRQSHSRAACPSVPLGQHLTPPPFSDECVWTLHFCFPPSRDGKMRDRLSHCLDIWTFICLRARHRFTAERSPVNSAGLALMSRSDTCCGLPKIKGWASCLKRYRKTYRSRSGSKRTWRLWFEIQSERRAALRYMTESLWIQCHSSSDTGFTLSAHLRRRMFNTQADIFAGRRAGCPVRLSGKWGLLVQPHWLTLGMAAACFVHDNNLLKAFLIVLYKMAYRDKVNEAIKMSE